MVAPKAEIRRFDVFAEYNRLLNKGKGVPPALAKGQALWLAKYVASHKFRKRSPVPRQLARRPARQGPPPVTAEGFPLLSGEPQTDELFDREIIARMGEEFHAWEFSPAIAQAIRDGRGMGRSAITCGRAGTGRGQPEERRA